MPKLLTDVIDTTHIESFLNTNSDFAFEIKVLRSLRRLGLSCRHGGTYEDPVTRKTRQFDIYAEGGRTDRRDLSKFSFAVECKNLRRNFPLLVHRLPRDSSESYLDVMFARPSSRSAMMMPDCSERIRLLGTVSPYVPGEPAGKAYDQVGRSEKGDIFSNDQDVFEKMSQALNAAHQLLEEAYVKACKVRSAAFVITVPVLVVPAETLWAVDYDHDGNVTSGPQVVSGATVYVGKEWSVGGNLGHSCALSHLEIVTIDHLGTFIDAWRNDLRLTSSAIGEFIQGTHRGT